MSRTRKIEAGDITAAEAAGHLGLSLAQFNFCLPALIDRGFPVADPTTGNYALDAISVWRRARFPNLFPAVSLPPPVSKLRDARERLGRYR